MTDLWYPWCATGDDCCGGGVGHGNCFCCSDDPGGYDVPPGGDGGPLQWLAHCGTVGGTCFGQSCANAAGDHYLDYSTGCTWVSPTFTLCGTPNNAWVLSIGVYPACDGNPVGRNAMRLILVNLDSGVEIARYEPPCPNLVNGQCDPPVNLTCNGTNTLELVQSLGLCTLPATIDVESVWPP